MIDFFTRLFGREPSGATAKERLRLVLLSDHLALAPDVIAALRSDLIEVISRYVDIDPARCDVTFEQQDRSIAMMANVPVLAMKPRPPAPPSRTDAPEPPPGEPPTQAGSSEPAPSPAPSNEETVSPSAALPQGSAQAAATPEGQARPRPRRRRRRKPAVSVIPAPAG